MLHLVEDTTGDRVFELLQSRRAQVAQGVAILAGSARRVVQNSCF